jgi:hypothetical protein
MIFNGLTWEILRTWDDNANMYVIEILFADVGGFYLS